MNGHSDPVLEPASFYPFPTANSAIECLTGARNVAAAHDCD